MDKRKIIIIGNASEGAEAAIFAALRNIENVNLEMIVTDYNKQSQETLNKIQLDIPRLLPIHYKIPITRAERRAEKRKESNGH